MQKCVERKAGGGRGNDVVARASTGSLYKADIQYKLSNVRQMWMGGRGIQSMSFKGVGLGHPQASSRHCICPVVCRRTWVRVVNFYVKS